MTKLKKKTAVKAASRDIWWKACMIPPEELVQDQRLGVLEIAGLVLGLVKILRPQEGEDEH
jgi:hypothetical protein